MEKPPLFRKCAEKKACGNTYLSELRTGSPVLPWAAAQAVTGLGDNLAPGNCGTLPLRTSNPESQ